MKYEAMEQIPIYCMQQKPGWMQNDFFVMRKKKHHQCYIYGRLCHAYLNFIWNLFVQERDREISIFTLHCYQ